MKLLKFFFKLVLFVPLFNQGVLSQTNILLINSSSEDDLTVCDNSTQFNVIIENPSPYYVTVDTLMVSLPIGVEYTAGSVIGGELMFQIIRGLFL